VGSASWDLRTQTGLGPPVPNWDLPVQSFKISVFDGILPNSVGICTPNESWTTLANSAIYATQAPVSTLNRLICPLFKRAGTWDNFRVRAFSQGVLPRGSDFLGQSGLGC